MTDYINSREEATEDEYDLKMLEQEYNSIQKVASNPLKSVVENMKIESELADIEAKINPKFSARPFHDSSRLIPVVDEDTKMDTKVETKMDTKVETKMDIRKLNGSTYLDLLLSDEKDDVVFLTESEEAANNGEYQFGKKYDFGEAVAELWPEFDYEKLDKEKVENQKKMERDLEEYKKMLLEEVDEGEKVINSKISAAKEVEEQLVSDLEARLKVLNGFDENRHKQIEATESRYETESQIIEYLDVYLGTESDSEEEQDDGYDSEGSEDSEEGGDMMNERLRLRATHLIRQVESKKKQKSSRLNIFKKLSSRSFFGSKKTKGFQGNRNLRAQLKRKGVNFMDVPTQKLGEMDDVRSMFLAKRDLRNTLLQSGVKFEECI